MYECIQVHSYHEQDSVLNEEGDLDNESEDSDFETMMTRKMKIQNRESASSTSSMAARYGSPMSVDE